MNIKISFSEIANLVTKGDNKIDEKDAQKARSLGLAFVLAGMKEHEFDKAVSENPQDVQAYLSNVGWTGSAKRYFYRGMSWLKSKFSKEKPKTLPEDEKRTSQTVREQRSVESKIDNAVKIMEQYGYDKNDPSSLEKAYKKAAGQWHPDRNSSPEAEIKMAEINNAYGMLKRATENIESK